MAGVSLSTLQYHFDDKEGLYRACAELNLPVATHISESASEVEYLRTGTGAWGGYGHLLVEPAGTTGTRLLAEHGLLGPNVVAAHCVVVDDEEIELLASTETGVAHCPRSNAALGCGVAPLAELRAGGARVGVGTDSPASAPSFDFFEELRSVVLSARTRARRPDVLSAGEALELGQDQVVPALGDLDGRREATELLADHARDAGLEIGGGRRRSAEQLRVRCRAPDRIGRQRIALCDLAHPFPGLVFLDPLLAFPSHACHPHVFPEPPGS